jgi:protein FAM50
VLSGLEGLYREDEVRQKKEKRNKKKSTTLSFALEEEEGTDSPADEPRPTKRAKLGKNPTVDTTFLPDREREEAERKQREEIRQQWLRDQEDVKKEIIEVAFAYFDGHSHRSEARVRGLGCSRSITFVTRP